MNGSALAPLAQLAKHPNLRLLLVCAGQGSDLSWSALLQPLRLAAQHGESGRLQIDCRDLADLADLADPGTPGAAPYDLALLVADLEHAAPPALPAFLAQCAQLPVWGAVGAPVWWLLQQGAFGNLPVALPWLFHADFDGPAEQATLHLYQLQHNRLSCVGNAASLDFALALIEVLCGSSLQNQIKEMLCLEKVRAGSELQHVAQQSRSLQPKLSEAVQLMQANLEEPLSTDDIANLVGLSRRQLERLFKQHLNNMPSRYYLELRLQRSRQLLLETHHSIVQIGLMCGFSSGSHFSTAFGMLFGTTPREERQKRLQNFDKLP